MIIGREPHFNDPLNPVNRCQVTREWYRTPIEGRCEFTIEMLDGSLEFKWLDAKGNSTRGHVLSSGDPDHCRYSGDVPPTYSLWVRSIAPPGYDELAVFTLTTRSHHRAKGHATVAEDARRLMDRGNGKPQTWCGCGKHSFPADADPYAAHREWLGRYAPSCHEDGDLLRLQLTGAVWFDVVMRGKGIGISAPPRHVEVLVEIDHPDYA